MRKVLKWAAIAVAVVLLGGFGWLSYRMEGVDQAYGLLRYGFPQVKQGELKVGDPAPDVELVALDGQTRFRLHERPEGSGGAKPLVLIFGSYT